MSGFFMIRREAFEASLRQLSLQGYKVLVDIIASAPEPLRIKEFPYVFRMRQHGESKLDALVSLEYLMLLLDKMLGGGSCAIRSFYGDRRSRGIRAHGRACRSAASRG